MKRCLPLLFFAFSAAGLAVPTDIEIPDDHWVAIYFESIDEVAGKVGLAPLKEKTLPEDSIEVRFWQGFGLSSLVGTQLCRTGNNWRAVRFTSDWSEDFTYEALPIEPPEGWSKFWTKLETFDIRTLPDASTLKGEVLAFDGVSYVIEISDGDSYRTYMYSNPQIQHWEQARKIESIADAMREDLVVVGEGDSNHWVVISFSAAVLIITGVAALILRKRKSEQGVALNTCPAASSKPS